MDARSVTIRQKIIKIGEAFYVILPPDVLNRLNVGEGDEVTVTVTPSE